MKIDFFEDIGGMDLTLVPENTEEIAKLLHYSMNGRAEKPSVTFRVEKEKCSLSIWMRNVNQDQQETSIKPFDDPNYFK